MSYHVALRSLQLSQRTKGTGTFADCIQHGLQGDHPASKLRQQIQSSSNHRLAVNSLSDRIGELLAVDLNPVGQAVRLANNDATYHRVWDFYNHTGNVVDKVPYSKVRQYDAGNQLSSHDGRMIEIVMHEKILEGYQNVLGLLLRSNQNHHTRINKIRDSRVSVVARIFKAGNIVVELGEFFEAFPHAKVSDACLKLGIHPRALERQLQEFGITAVMLKRACMLASASHEILWGERSFAEIAKRHGYTDGAHLGHSVAMATGGMTPSIVRSLGKI